MRVQSYRDLRVWQRAVDLACVAYAIAQASLTELETHLTVAERVGFTPQDIIARAMVVCAEVGRMLTAMRARLAERSSRPDRQTPIARRP